MIITMIEKIKAVLPIGYKLEMFKNGIFYLTFNNRGVFDYSRIIDQPVLDLYWDYRLQLANGDLSKSQKNQIKEHLLEKCHRFKNNESMIKDPSNHSEWIYTPTFLLLSLGGDDRSSIDTKTLKNKYNTSTLPNTDIKRSNCTSSSTSFDSFIKLENFHFELMAAHMLNLLDIKNFQKELRYSVFDYFVSREKHQKFSFCMTPSGTDVEFLATWLGLCRSKELYGQEGKTSVFINAAHEVGSGTSIAAQLKHFSSLSPIGLTQSVNTLIDPSFDHINLETFATRDAAADIIHGRDHLKVIDAKIQECIEDKIVPVVHYVHSTKTGMSVPGFSVIKHLKSKYGQKIVVIVDAAQLRLQSEAVEDYLEQDFNVIVTGSKFIGAPPFCGGLIINSNEKNSLEKTDLVLSAPFDHYFDHWSLPKEFKRNIKTDWVNWGQAMRWQAAAFEMSRFDDIPYSFQDELIKEWRKKVEQILNNFSHIKVLDFADNQHLPGDASSLSRSNSIISFEILTSWGRDKNKLKKLHAEMSESPLSCEIGQPVQVSTGQDERYALRIALGAQNLINAYTRTEGYGFDDCLEYLLVDDQKLIDKLNTLIAQYDYEN